MPTMFREMVFEGLADFLPGALEAAVPIFHQSGQEDGGIGRAAEEGDIPGLGFRDGGEDFIGEAYLAFDGADEFSSFFHKPASPTA